MELIPKQLEVVELPVATKIFLSGPAGSGKTTAAVERLTYLIESGVPANDILILLPQRSLAGPYLDRFRKPSFPAGGQPDIATLGGLARRLLELYWPVFAGKAGFEKPDQAPTFLTLESAQYYMAYLVRPLIEREGFFSSVTIQRNRLYSQVLDNLNKAAVHGFPYTEISKRLKSAWIGDAGQKSIFENAQHCAALFRSFCYRHNLLDFSLQIELFSRYLWPSHPVRRYFLGEYRHLIYDNLEEDVPVSHQFVEEILPEVDSALLVYDEDAGYRSFLGADPQSAVRLRGKCAQKVIFHQSFITPAELEKFNKSLRQYFLSGMPPSEIHPPGEGQGGFSVHYHQYYPEMVTWIGEQTASLIDQGTSPGQIAVLAPYLSDSLRFLLQEELTSRKIPSTSHRPSRSLREEPASRCLLTLAAAAHPLWEINPTRFELTTALMQSITDLDLTRASMLADQGADFSDGLLRWIEFDDFPQKLQSRISYSIGGRYQNLISWVKLYRSQAPQPLDHFFSRLFGEILSQPGFGFHRDFDRAQAAANLIESVKKFRKSVGGALDLSVAELGKEYYLMVLEGIISAQYLSAWQERPERAVFLAPSYTYLVNNFPVDFQFWIDAGSRGWYERIYQPLTHPYVLNCSWEIGQPWTDQEELQQSKQTLARLTTGLIRRCRKQAFICFTELDERGYEQKGLLIQAVNQALQQRSM